MVVMGISSNIMKSPSPKYYMIFSDMTLYSDTLNRSDITPICERITELDLITDFDLITKASVTIMADFSPEFDPPVRWRSKHQTKNDC